jgi:hypothetical protein
MNCRLNESAHSEQGLPHTNFLQKNNPNCRSPTNPKGEKENGDSRIKQCNNKQSSYCPNAVELEDSQEPCNKREELQTLKTSSGARRTGPVLRLVRGPGWSEPAAPVEDEAVQAVLAMNQKHILLARNY